MKIIDLLNRIANGEEVPKKIKYDDIEYKITKVMLEDNKYWKNYINEDMECLYPINTNYLNDEIEILEEEKETKSLTKKDIEALGYACGEIQKCFTNGWTKSLENKPLEEEKKIPEKLDMVLLGQSDNWTRKYSKDTKKMENTHIELNPYVIDIIRENTLEIQHKFNEIIDYLKSKGE